MFRQQQSYFRKKFAPVHSSVSKFIAHVVSGLEHFHARVLHVEAGIDPSSRFAWTCLECCSQRLSGYLVGLSELYPRYDRFGSRKPFLYDCQLAHLLSTYDPHPTHKPLFNLHTSATDADQAHIQPHNVSPNSARPVWIDKAGTRTGENTFKHSFVHKTDQGRIRIVGAIGSSSKGTLASEIVPVDDCALSIMSDGMKVAAYHSESSSAGPSTSYTTPSRLLERRQALSTYFVPSGPVTSETATPSQFPDATPSVSSDTAGNSFSTSPFSISEFPTSSITIPPVISTASATQTSSVFSETRSPSASLSLATPSPTSEGSTPTSSGTPLPTSSMDSPSSSLPISSGATPSSTLLTSASVPSSTVAPTSLPTSLPTSRVPPTVTSTPSSSTSPSSSRRTTLRLPTTTPSSSSVYSTPRTSSTFTSVRSTTSNAPSSPLSTSSHSTRFTTTVIRTVFTNGKTTTITTIIETNSLSTDIARETSGIAHNTGAIIGIAISAAVVLLVTVCLMFFACKRRSQRSHHGSTDNILGLARQSSWRPPLDGDDESYVEGYGATMAGGGQAGPLSRSNSSENPFSGERSSGEGGNGSAESASAGMPRPLDPVFGGQHLYVAGMGEIGEERRSSPENGSSETQITSACHPGLANLLPVDDEGRLNNTAGSSYSTTSLTLGGDMSSQSHCATRDGLLKAYSTSRKRSSVPGPRPMSDDDKYRRHSSTPPSAFLGIREKPSSPERSPDSNDKGSIRSFIGRLRNSRHTSLQSMMTIRGNGNRATSQESLTTRVMTNLYSPSLLNPPIPLPQPSPAMLHFPRGVTGNGYSASDTMPYAYRYPNASSVLWPPVTLPPAPSPVPTDNSSMVEGLLHPRLRMSSGLPHQASVTSLRDHEDYTRPINGLVNNHLRSTTTFDTHDTMSEHEDSSPRIGTTS